MLVTNEDCVKCKSIGITESDAEGINEGPLLGLKDNIIESDVLWGTVVSTE